MSKKLFKGILFSFLSIVVLVLPLGVLFYFRYDEWVVYGESTQVVTGVVIGLVYAVLVIKGALKSISSKISALINMFVVLIIIWFLDSIMDDLFWIVLAMNVGYILFLIVSAIAQSYLEYNKAYRNERARIQARKEINEDEIIGV